MRLRERVGAWPSKVNIVNNVFHSSQVPEAAVLFEPTSYPGDVYAAGNLLQTLTGADLSTVKAPIAVPSDRRVTTHQVPELEAQMLPFVGLPDHRTAEERQLITSLRLLLAP